MLAAGDAPVVADQIGADLAGPGVLPLGEGADRDLVHQTRGRLGMGAPAYAQGTFLGAQQPVDGGSADERELPARVGVQGEFAKLLQHRQLSAQDRHQPFAAQTAEQVPDGDDLAHRHPGIQRGERILEDDLHLAAEGDHPLRIDPPFNWFAAERPRTAVPRPSGHAIGLPFGASTTLIHSGQEVGGCNDAAWKIRRRA